MENKFIFDRSSNIILYGAAAIGLILKEKLEKNGYSVKGFIDKRADEVPFYLDLPVWKIDKVPVTDTANGKTIVIIAVKNVFEHDTIVRELYKNGFCNIIYKPYSTLYNYATNLEETVGQVYDELMNNDCINAVEKVPAVTLNFDSRSKDFAIIERHENSIVAYIPVEFIYTNDYCSEGMKKWGNINLFAFFTHLDFFQYLAGNRNASYQHYLNEYCVYTAKLRNTIKITEKWKENVLHNRAIIFEQMNMSLEIDKDFFVRNAAEAKWNVDKGYFNLKSGKHRCSFLVSRGFRHIPLKISQEDYQLYTNISCTIELQQKLLRDNVETLNIPIPHPLYYRKFNLGNELYYGLLEKYTHDLAKKTYYEYDRVSFEKVQILEILSDSNMVARHFARMGCSVHCVQEDTDDIMDELQHIPNRLIYLNGTTNVSFDIVFWNAKLKPNSYSFIQQFRFKKIVVICDNIQIEQYKSDFSSTVKIFSSITEFGDLTVYECV